MTHRERILAALAHKEPDRVPFDLGGMAQSGINKTAYANLRKYLGLPDREITIQNNITQIAKPDDDICERLGTDTYMVYGKWASPKNVKPYEEDGYLVYTDEWGIGRRMPNQGGYYYDMYSNPFDVDDVEERWKTFMWPDPTDPARFNGMREDAKRAREKGKFVVLMGLCPGIMEMYSWFRGFERFYMDLAAEPETSARFLGKMAELKFAFWERAFSEIGEYVDAVNEVDDLAGQSSMLMSPTTYRQVIKPFHRELFSNIKRIAPDKKLLFHTCGAVRRIIPDLIEIGVDILNPVQISADGMDPFELKRDFGNDICFWGGGIDTQSILGVGPPEKIRDHVRRNIEAFAPGGGFIFSTDHAVQPNVPPENYMIMWDAVQKYGAYT
ncbi:MAG: hypothetical protein HYX78_03855 [Armatimonadetes bacterium]|nr:hypothetical protein [Armatimonadota bacterium]